MTVDIKKILVPLDFSDNSAGALEYARGLASRLDAALHLVHVCEIPPMPRGKLDAFGIGYTDWATHFTEEAKRELAAAAATVSGATVTTEVLVGNVPKAIVAAAEANHADLIAMGTHGHGAVMHIVMGNVAERVVRTAGCPVLTVREQRDHDA